MSNREARVFVIAACSLGGIGAAAAEALFSSFLLSGIRAYRLVFSYSRRTAR